MDAARVRVGQDDRSPNSVANLSQKAKELVERCLRGDLSWIDVELNLADKGFFP
jgi:hypothetical protein